MVVWLLSNTNVHLFSHHSFAAPSALSHPTAAMAATLLQSVAFTSWGFFEFSPWLVEFCYACDVPSICASQTTLFSFVETLTVS